MRLNITAEFAKQNDCLERMIPADLRLLVSERDEALRERDALREQYQELLYCVANKYEGETRHETAKRIILNNQSSVVASTIKAASKGD